MPTFGFPRKSSFQTARGARNATDGEVPPPQASPDAGMLQNIVSDIGDNKALAAQNEANSQAAATQAAGYQREIEAYGIVAGISEENATLEGMAGNIKQLQANRALMKSLGSQRASVAAAGFASSGSSLDLYKSSLQEGFLNEQLIGTQTSINQSGYFQQAAAARASGEGAQLASEAAMELSRSYTAAGQLATATAASETEALQTYLETTGGIGDNSEASTPFKMWYDSGYSLHIQAGTPGKPNTNAARALTAQTLGLNIDDGET